MIKLLVSTKHLFGFSNRFAAVFILSIITFDILIFAFIIINFDVLLM